MTEYEYSRKALRISSSTSMSMMRSTTGSSGGGVRVLLRGIRAGAPCVGGAVPILAHPAAPVRSDPPVNGQVAVPVVGQLKVPTLRWGSVGLDAGSSLRS